MSIFMCMQRLESVLSPLCPLHGVKCPTSDKVTWRPDPRPEATPQQIAAAQAAIDAFDTSDAAQQAWEADQQPERKGIRAAAASAIAANSQDILDCQTFIAIAGPSNAQVVAFVKSLAQQMIRSKQHETQIIKRLIQID